MNKADVINKVSIISKVDIVDCEKVVGALEKVLEDEFKSSKGLSDAFQKFCKLINIFKIRMV